MSTAPFVHALNVGLSAVDGVTVFGVVLRACGARHVMRSGFGQRVKSPEAGSRAAATLKDSATRRSSGGRGHALKITYHNPTTPVQYAESVHTRGVTRHVRADYLIARSQRNERFGQVLTDAKAACFM